MSARARVEAALAAMTKGPWHTEESETMAGVIGGPLGAGGHPNESPFIADVGSQRDVEAIATLRNDTAAALAEAEAERDRLAALVARVPHLAPLTDDPHEPLVRSVEDHVTFAMKAECARLGGRCAFEEARDA